MQEHTGTPEARWFGALLMAGFAIPLFVWSAFNAGYFDIDSQNFVIPLAIFLGAPLAFLAALWSRDHYANGLLAGVFGGFWFTYGGLLWLSQTGVVEAAGRHMYALFFVAWAITFAIVWLGSVRQNWTFSLVALGASVMLVLLGVHYFGAGRGFLEAGGWVGFITAGLAWYASLAETLRLEYQRPVLPTDWSWFRQFRAGHR